MSSTSMYVPTLEINENDITNLIGLIYKHQRLLKEFGAIKIQLGSKCKLALKKRRKRLFTHPITTQVVQMSKDDLIYSVREAALLDDSIEQSPPIKDAAAFWLSVSCLNKQKRHLNISLSPNKSYFDTKTSGSYFDIHRLPGLSLLKIGGKEVTEQCVPSIKIAHGPGSILPLSCARQHLFSIDYHHEGGAHHWYIIPSSQRDLLQSIINKQNSSSCLDHGQILIDPLMLDRYHIRYHRVIQRPNEFVVLSCGTLAQSFTEDASSSESIDFALPSWIEEGHANNSMSSCRHGCFHDEIDQILSRTAPSGSVSDEYQSSEDITASTYTYEDFLNSDDVNCSRVAFEEFMGLLSPTDIFSDSIFSQIDTHINT
ncbi:unnamed protein product, partial [Adineta steineri]